MDLSFLNPFDEIFQLGQIRYIFTGRLQTSQFSTERIVEILSQRPNLRQTVSDSRSLDTPTCTSLKNPLMSDLLMS